MAAEGQSYKTSTECVWRKGKHLGKVRGDNDRNNIAQEFSNMAMFSKFRNIFHLEL